MFLGIFPFFQIAQFIDIQLLIILFYYCLYLCGVGCDFSSFICDFIYMGLFLFLFDKFGNSFTNFVNSFKEPPPGFFVSSVFFFYFDIIDLCYNLLFPFFWWFWTLFVVFCFPTPLSVRLGCVFETSLPSLERPGLLYTSLLWPPLMNPRRFGLLCFHFHWLTCTFSFPL